MTIDIRDIKSARREFGTQYEENHSIVLCTVTAVNSSVDVPNQPGYVWVLEFNQSASPAPALNDRGFLVESGTPVFVEKIIGKPQFQQRRIISLYTDSISPTATTDPQRFAVSHHGANHQWPLEGFPGPDVVRVYQPALMPLKTIYDGLSLTVYVQPLIYIVDGVRKYFPGQTVDLSGYVPGTVSRALRVLIYLDRDNNTAEALAGTEVTDSLLTPVPLPPVPPSAEPSAYIRLANGQTTVTADDYVDSRQFLGSVSANRLNNLNAITNPDKLTDGASVGYEIGSIWVNTVTKAVFICADAINFPYTWRQIYGHFSTVSTSAPTADDDGDEGYTAGSIWVKDELSVSDVVFVCLDASIGDAVWHRIPPEAVTNAPDANDDLDSGYSKGVLWIEQATAPAPYKAHISVKDDTGAADWKRITNKKNNTTATSDPTTGDDANDGYEIGSIWVNVFNNLDRVFIAASVDIGAAVWRRISAFGGARVWHNAAQAVATSTAVALSFNQESYDDSGYHDLATNTSRLTVPEDGLYHIGGAITYESNAVGERYAFIRVNGTEYIVDAQSPAVITASQNTRVNVSTDYELSAGDYVELVAWQTSGGDLDANVITERTPIFWIHRIR